LKWGHGSLYPKAFSNRNPLDLIKPDFIAGAIGELRGAGAPTGSE
jgi:hypothetical protein